MPRSFLITFLLTAQLISWNASPLFLCMDGEGALCIDLGPGSCTCCRYHQGLAEGTWEHRSPDEHRCMSAHGSLDHQASPIRVGGPPCDCTHLQITVAWTAVTVSPEGSRFVVLPSYSALVGNGGAACVLLLSRAGDSLSAPSNEHSVQSVPRSVILRC